MDAAYKLITSNLRLVVAIALKFYGTIHNILDLIQEGNIGLMQAVKQFDPYRGAKLSSYAVWWIRAYILRYLINKAKMVKIGTTETQRKLFFRLNKEHERLMKEGFNPGAKVLAQMLDVKEEDVQEMAKRLMAPDLSLDYVYGEESSQTLADRIGVEDNIAERVSDDELKSKRLAKLEEVKERFKTALNPKERTIYEKRLFALEPATLQELGQELGITRERVRQLESGILKKFKQELGNDDDLFGGGTA
jgi:RNA polymerase sigma-32 factor